MDQLNSRIKLITSELKQYVETKIDLMVINYSNQIAGWLGASIQKLIGFIILSIGLFFSFIGLAIYLGELLDNLFVGYLIVGIPMMLIGLLLASLKPKRIAKGIQNQFMEGVLDSVDKKQNDSLDQLPEPKEKELVQGNE